MKNILCYGDSNTWGYVPGVGIRHPKQVRWTGVLAAELGEGYTVIEDGINGRTTVWDDPVNQCRNGLHSLGYSLYRAKPLDLVIVMLGTNDLNYTDAQGYYEGISMLAKRILGANRSFPGTSDVFLSESRILLVSPIELTPDMPAFKESLKFPEYTAQAAEALNVPWIDGAAFAKPSHLDGCHMDAENHGRLGRAVAQKVKEIFE